MSSVRTPFVQCDPVAERPGSTSHLEVQARGGSRSQSSGREAVNYNLSMWVYVSVAGLLCMVMIGYALMLLLLVAHLILVIQAAIKASRGEAVRYPFTLRFIK